MTPREKAKELVDKFIEHTMDWDILDGYVDDILRAKQCALIAVDEVLKSQNNIYGVNNRATKFYLEVKHELEKL